MAKRQNKYRKDYSVWLAVTGLIGLGIGIALLMNGMDVKLLNPKGLIARQQSDLMIFSILLLLSVAVPTLFILYSFAWHYRESNKRAVYDPRARDNKLVTASMWAIPSVLVVVLGLVMWPATHRLEPKKAIATDVKPLTIKVVAMRWKWLFLYPDQNVATVNFVQLPVGTPVEFQLTADEAPMSSFWIPHLAGQLYAMTGHVTRLNIMAEEPGDYPGMSAEINGRGFAGMKFTTRVSSPEDFDRWIQDMKQSPDRLDAANYENLLKPSENNPIELFSSFDSSLYDNMLQKYTGSHDHQPAAEGSGH